MNYKEFYNKKYDVYKRQVERNYCKRTKIIYGGIPFWFNVLLAESRIQSIS